MKIIDTHAHYDDEAFDEDRASLMAKMQENGVEKIICCASNWASVEKIQGLLAEYPHLVAALGIHPSDGRDYTDEVEAELYNLLKKDRVVAVGEIGLDYYWEENPSKEWQKETLLRQFDLAREVQKPVILHVRDAHGDIIKILRQQKGLSGVIHSFSGSVETAKEAVKMGYYLGIGGVSTFKNAKALPQVIEEIPLEFLLTETDAPYLTPVPFRGKRNQSDYIRYVIEVIARIKNIPKEECSEILRANAIRLFGL